MATVTISGAGAHVAAATTDRIPASKGGTKGYLTPALLGNFLAVNTLAAGTITTSQPMTLTQTWNAGAVTFTGLLVNVTNTSSAATSMLLDLQIGGTTVWKVLRSGATLIGGANAPTSRILGLGDTTVDANYGVQIGNAAGSWYLDARDVSGSGNFWFSTGGASLFAVLRNGGVALNGSPAEAGAQHTLVVRKTGIADATATGIITVTVPNANHNAAIFLDILGHLGTGTDASESSRCATGCIVLARVSGGDTVATAAALTTAQIATTSGGGTLTLAYDVSTLTGASSATQTFTIRLTLTVSGTITNHTAVVSARLLNSLATGVTMAAA